MKRSLLLLLISSLLFALTDDKTLIRTAYANPNDEGQSSKALLLSFPSGHDPVRIVKVMSGTLELKSSGRKYPNTSVWETFFDGGDDWLTNTSLRVRNVSTKTITYLEVSCILQESSDWQAEIAKHHGVPVVGHASNAVGRRPEEALYSTRSGRKLTPDTRPAFELAPGQEFAISLEDPQSYPALKSQVEQTEPMSSATACNGGIGTIYFEDDTKWHGMGNEYSKPVGPGQWVTISFEQWLNYGKEESK